MRLENNKLVIILVRILVQFVAGVFLTLRESELAREVPL